jgi:hypothetical protein
MLFPEFPFKLFSCSYMRPLTPHYVLGVQPSIVHGRHFYSTSCITDTCAGIIHSFVMCYEVTNQAQIRTRTLLRRLLTMWMNHYTEDQANCCASHVPDALRD